MRTEPGEMRPEPEDLAREVNNKTRTPQTIMPVELADLLLYALGEAYGMIEDGRNIYDPPEWMDTVWSFAFHALLDARRAGMLPEMQDAPAHWQDFADYITAHHKARMENGGL